MSAASLVNRIWWVILREEILAVISRHVALDPDKVLVKMDRGKSVSTLEVDIEPGRPTRRLDLRCADHGRRCGQFCKHRAHTAVSGENVF